MANKNIFTLDAVSGIDNDIVEKNLIKRSVMWHNKVIRKKKPFIPIIAAAATFIIVLSSVLMLLPNSQVPIYVGMTVSNEAPVVETANAPGLFNGSSLLFTEGYSYPTLSIATLDASSSNDSKKDKDKNKGENGSHSMEASSGPYYAQPNEDIYILVHISNPGGYEILSFTLNGVKYSSYMFEPGSDLETLILKYNVGNVEGVQQYTIDAIKYVDGEEIKDVRMEGDRTIEVLVGSDGTDVDLNARFSGWDLVISPVWSDAFTGEKKLLSLGLYDGETLVMELEPDATVFKNLPMNSRLLLVATYSNNAETMTARTVIQTPAQSEGLKIINGVVTGIGTCTDTKLYINMPIGDNAFNGNKDITQVHLGSGVKSIGISAFSGCEKLKNISFSKGLETIGSNAFAFCPSIKSLILPDGVTKICPDALWASENITTLVIPASVTDLGYYDADKVDGWDVGGSLFGHVKDVRIYCEAERQPSGWIESWARGDINSKVTVYWGDDWTYVNGVPKPNSNKTPMQQDANRDPSHIAIDDADLTIISGPNNGNSSESYTKIFDLNVDTKVCTTDLETPIIWSYSAPKHIASYSLVGANDDRSYEARVPVNFTLYGSDDGKSWEVIDTHTRDTEPDFYEFDNYEERNFKLSESVTYQYFKLEIVQPFTNLYQFSEIILYTQEES